MTALAGLRIGLVGPLAPPAGGMAGQTRQLADLLAAAGAEVTLVRTNPPYRPAWVQCLRGVRSLARLLPYLASLWCAAGRVQLFHVMANSGWAWHLFAAPAIWVARLRGVPAVVNYRGGGAEGFLDAQAPLVRLTMRRAATLAVPSGFLHEIFGRHGMPAAVLPNVVDTAHFRPQHEVRVPGAHVVVIRNLEPVYDNASALRAFARVLQRRPDARLTIAGSGPQEDELRALAVSLGVGAQVHFAGRLDRDGVAALLQQADVCLNPSLADNMPNSVLEALASGVPVVSTRVGGVPHLVQHEVTALLVPPHDPEAMAAAVLRLLDEPALWQHLRSAGLGESRRYAWDRVAPVLVDVYRRALAA